MCVCVYERETETETETETERDRQRQAGWVGGKCLHICVSPLTSACVRACVCVSACAVLSLGLAPTAHSLPSLARAVSNSLHPGKWRSQTKITTSRSLPAGRRCWCVDSPACLSVRHGALSFCPPAHYFFKLSFWQHALTHMHAFMPSTLLSP